MYTMHIPSSFLWALDHRHVCTIVIVSLYNTTAQNFSVLPPDAGS